MKKQISLLDSENDLALFSLMIKGEQKALEVLYKRYYTLLFNYGMKCNPDKELVKDCIHDLFVNLYNNFRISVNVTVRAYLLRSLRNIMIDKLVVQHKTTSLDDFVLYIPESSDLFEQLFSKNDKDLELANLLLRAIYQLSPQQKKVLYLRYIKGLSHKEIADIMAMNIQSSKNLVNRTLVKLRSLVGIDRNTLFICLLIIRSAYLN